jgi:hypothetical protein
MAGKIGMNSLWNDAPCRGFYSSSLAFLVAILRSGQNGILACREERDYWADHEPASFLMKATYLPGYKQHVTMSPSPGQIDGRAVLLAPESDPAAKGPIRAADGDQHLSRLHR